MAEIISAEQFKKRLAQLCLSGVTMELPRRQRDRQIILKSIALHLAKGRSYTERELNASLMSWVGEVGHSLQVDHAALRRALVDEKYLKRSADGASYRLSPSAGAEQFEPAVDELNPSAVIEDAIRESSAKREQFRKQQG